MSTTWRGMNACLIARHVMGCKRLRRKVVKSRVDDVAGDICRLYREDDTSHAGECTLVRRAATDPR